MDYKEITPQELNENACKLIGDDWMLITAGTREKINTMTAAWGGLGVMWGKPVAITVIRPQRYTKEFVDAQDTMSLTFYKADMKNALAYLGKVSGRDEDKIGKANLTVKYENDTPYFEEADIVLIVRKLYEDGIKPEGFLDQQIDSKWYPDKDYHTMYICEIEKVMVRTRSQ